MSDNGVPGDFELLAPWLPIIRRMRQAAAGPAPAIVTMTVVTDEYGNPLYPWVSPVVRRLEPKASAEAAFVAVVNLLACAEAGGL